ncbi:anchored repeat-type ABC transporter permease subunit [Corynebacterium macclintockiae]|uniref:anchored repeat-type ABC transporter permease subunit n=1 Tax=Corynebacterium macclintockiae TaxID=2913501 RepID=UPI003EC14BA1
MISFSQFLADLSNPALAFLPKALLVAVLSALVCGVIGTHVVLRGMAFIGDAVAHAVFPGLAIAFALQFSVIAGGAVAGAVVALLIALFSQRRRVKEDTVIGIFFAAAFALGLVVISKAQGYTASLNSFLFGSITGVSNSDIIFSAVVGAIVILAVAALHKEIVAVSVDRETAAAMGIRVLLIDIVLYLAVTAAVVMSVRTVGNILVLALLITPAATARLWTDRLVVMMSLSAVIGMVGSFVGVYVSWAIDVPTGATIVLVLTVVFLFSFFVATPIRAAKQSNKPSQVVATNAEQA